MANDEEAGVTGRFSMGLIELSSGIVLLLLALCTTLVVQLQLYPPLGFLPGFIAIPAIFWGAASLQKRFPETNDATYSFSTSTMPIVFTASLIVPLTLTVIPEPYRDQTMPLIFGLTVAAGLLLINDGKRHVHVLAAVSALLGAVLTLFSGGMMSAVLYCSVFGLLLLLAGAASLRRNLKP